MDEDVAVAFDIAGVVSIEMDEMGIESESGVAEEEGARRSDSM